jgi:hypothetical protein
MEEEELFGLAWNRTPLLYEIAIRYKGTTHISLPFILPLSWL